MSHTLTFFKSAVETVSLEVNKTFNEELDNKLENEEREEINAILRKII